MHTLSFFSNNETPFLLQKYNVLKTNTHTLAETSALATSAAIAVDKSSW